LRYGPTPSFRAPLRVTAAVMRETSATQAAPAGTQQYLFCQAATRFRFIVSSLVQRWPSSRRQGGSRQSAKGAVKGGPRSTRPVMTLARRSLVEAPHPD
jgi:hypothetical protein